MISNIGTISIIVVIATMIFSIPLHEYMHGFVAKKLGDPTAEIEGRLSLNPLKHVDVMFTILLPAILMLFNLPPIFVAKPVPFNPDNVRYGEYGTALVGLAGPFTNLFIAVLSSVVFRLVMPSGFWGDVAFPMFIQINIVLFVFNMLPFPPLDGSRLLYAFAPEPIQRVMQKLESAGLGITLVIVFLLLPFISPIVSNISESIYSFLLR